MPALNVLFFGLHINVVLYKKMAKGILSAVFSAGLTAACLQEFAHAKENKDAYDIIKLGFSLRREDLE